MKAEVEQNELKDKNQSDSEISIEFDKTHDNKMLFKSNQFIYQIYNSNSKHLKRPIRRKLNMRNNTRKISLVERETKFGRKTGRLKLMSSMKIEGSIKEEQLK